MLSRRKSADTTYIRPRDHIWTVGGRGTYFLADSLPIGWTSRKIRDVHVTSISGRMQTEGHDPAFQYTPSSVDADDAAFRLAKIVCFDFKSDFHALHKPVAYSEPSGYTDRSKDFEHLFTPDGSLRNSSTICLCGVGRVGGKHMFMRPDDCRLEPIKGDLKKLYMIFRESKLEKYIDGQIFYPLGDLANRLFLTQDITDKKINNEVKQTLSQINKKIVGLTISQIALSSVTIVNAGGLNKYAAIERVLGFRKPSGEQLVNVLCTDSQVAQKLIDKGINHIIKISDLPGE